MISNGAIKEIISDFEIIKSFPKSGQKSVHLVKNKNEQLLILKVVSESDERVKREIDIVTQNKISNVPKIISVNKIEYEGELYLLIFEEFIQGETLKERLVKEKLTTKESMKLLESLLKICVELEEIGVVHRDIKPDNILIRKEEFFLIDFGIARLLNDKSLTMTQAKMGPHTPGYGAPELFQYSKKNIDSRADLFSIGVVVFESITGTHPFITGDERDVNQIWYQTVTVTPKHYIIKGDTASQLIGFIMTLMQKHITRRPPSAKQAFEWYKAIVPTIIY
ncbi:serine/threonine-protein kinase [Fusibacter sp. 3D3]|uniref:serine/threonine protein kinase n=1 Tax=Fusibacter sp. 3D3 TaxID=1048380 RepID=UPI0008537E11|nr:serine/threonine-protein kinase [Fusibacter sp. 3D3]GAU78156.1 serine/threonine protein kinase [Fusibacter sp. 3D3]